MGILDRAAKMEKRIRGVIENLFGKEEARQPAQWPQAKPDRRSHVPIMPPVGELGEAV